MGAIIDKAKGRVKQAAGDLGGNKALKREGRRDELKGKIEGAVGAVKGAAKDVGHALNRAVKEPSHPSTR